MNYDLQKIQKSVKDCLENFLNQDIFLLQIDVSERAITHRLACNLQSKFSQLHVDCEYNRKNARIKRMDQNDLQSAQIYPDIIVHKRDSDSNNILAIEIKKHGTKKIEEDRKRLEIFTKEGHNYKFGLLVIFNVKEKHQTKPTCEWFIDGKNITV